jgi:glycerophosphoryl diester phosphodiesterase
MMFTSLPRPTIFAHRGASAHAPENTLAAFSLALRQEADGIELDAKLSKDRHVVVIHDSTVYRTTGVQGRVSEMTLSELRALDAGSHFDITFKGEQIPTLDEVFAAVGRLAFINIELTNYASPFDELPEKVVRSIRRHNLAERVMFSSFNPIALKRAKGLLPTVPIGMLAFPGRKGSWQRARLLESLMQYEALHPEAGDVTPSLVERFHHKGKRLHVYTVNTADDMRRLFRLGVDGIFTDDPVLAREVLARLQVERK